MKILTLGDSWTFGSESSDPSAKSWPAQMASLYDVDVVNLGRGGSSNQRAARIGMEELCRDPNYDWVIWGLGPASRTEVLKKGKWQQIWPGRNGEPLDQIYSEFWHSWNDVQLTMLLTLQFMSFVKMIGAKLFITGLSLFPSNYKNELTWIVDYKKDYNFNALGMPLDEFDIGVEDLHRKLISLQAIHNKILQYQREYLFDVPQDYMKSPVVEDKFGKAIWAPGGHPNDTGYQILAEYFASKIRLL